jgi:flagellin
MARINTNVASLTAQRGLSKSQKAMDSTLQRLSTGLRINRGADDPSGLIASETLRSEISGINQAIDNSQRASNVISTAEGALSEVAALLLNVKGMVVQAANTGALSPDEISANQLQVDSAVQSITRIANTTTFAGLKLINGSMDYVTSGVDPAAMTALEITQANFGSREAIPVKVDVVTSAKPAELQFRGSAVASAVTLEVTGAEGVQVLQFTAGTRASAVAYAVNSISDSTGVRAELINSATPGSGIVFKSDQYGSRQFVSVAAQKGSFGTVDAAGAGRTRAVGQDASATVNGALTVGDGLTLKLNTSALELNLTLDASFGTGQTEFAVTGGGAMFQLGPKVSSNQQANVGVQSVAASKLGNQGVGFLSDVGDRRPGQPRDRGVGQGRPDPGDGDPPGGRCSAAGSGRSRRTRSTRTSTR